MLRVTSPALGSADSSLDQSATSIQILLWSRDMFLIKLRLYWKNICQAAVYWKTRKKTALKSKRIGNLGFSVLLRLMSARIIVQSLYIALDLLKSHLLPLWLSTKFRFLFRVVSILLSKMWLLDKGRDMGSLGENMMGWMQSRGDRSSIVLKAMLIADSNTFLKFMLISSWLHSKFWHWLQLS